MSIVLNGTTGITSTGITETSDGNVGIGTSSPAKKLQLDGGNSYTATTRFSYGSSAPTYYADWGYKSSGDGNKVFLTITDNGSAEDVLVADYNGNVGIGASSPSNTLEVKSPTNDNGIRLSNSAGSYYHLVRSNGDGLLFDADAGNTGGSGADIRFQIKGGEKARITSVGDLLVGVTSGNPGYVNTATGATVRPNGLSCFSRSGADYAVVVNSNNAGTQYLIALRSSGVSVGAITSNGTSAQYSTSSDYRLKENWVAVVDASTRVNALKPVNFAWKATGERVDGFLAHEVQDVVPEAISGTKDAVETYTDDEGNEQTRPVYQGIDQSKLVPLLTAALQEALAKIDDLTARVSALETA